MKYLRIFKTLVFLFIINTLSGQHISNQQIDSLVALALDESPSVGIAIAIVKDGKVIHSKGYGLASSEKKTKVDENTVFAIASNSKAFTAAALSILIDEGKLTWQDKVVDHIPEFKMYDDYVTANFNIEDLLTHRSGLGLGVGDLMFFPDGSDFIMDDILKSFQYHKPTSAFRTKYDYDNLLYLVAGEVIKRVSGLSWADFVQTRIFNPLGMDNSAPLSGMLPKNANMALPHSSYGNEIKQLETYDNNQIGAAGGIYASVNDLTKWMLMQLNDGKYGKDLTKELFTQSRQKEMWSPHTMIRFKVEPDLRSNTHLSAYGLGWGISDKKGKIIAEHTGGLPGMLSRTVLVPELDLGIVVLTNSDPGGWAYYSIPETILDSYLEIEPREWVKNLSKRANSRGMESDSVTTAVWKIIENNTNQKIKAEDIIGNYRDNWFGDVEIALKNTKLWFTCKRSPKLNGEMFYYQATTFAVKWEYTEMPCDAFATFNLDQDGKAIQIKMKGISPNIDFSFDFHDLDLRRIN